jgi:hypothetical protein
MASFFRFAHVVRKESNPIDNKHLDRSRYCRIVATAGEQKDWLIEGSKRALADELIFSRGGALLERDAWAYDEVELSSRLSVQVFFLFGIPERQDLPWLEGPTLGE